MAEKDQRINAADPGGERETLPGEQLQFKKRARRRLVGAIALALAAVIVLPMVMDQEPKPLTQDIQIRIPSQDTSAVSTLARTVTGKPAPTPLPTPPKPAEPAPTAAPAAAPIAAAQPAAKPAATPETVPAPAELPNAVPVAAAPKVSETKPEKPEKSITPPPNKEQWVVQLGAYQDLANVKAMQNRLKALGLASFTEKIETPQGPRTRVRGGPFASRGAAEKAQAQLKKLAIGAPAGGVVAQKQ
ncbi:MAG: SPOR domain-containing protein [Sterolibacterium sp.]|jgi:DedD protein